MVATLLRGFNYLYKVSVYQIKFDWSQASCPIGTTEHWQLHPSDSRSTLMYARTTDRTPQISDVRLDSLTPPAPEAGDLWNYSSYNCI